MLPTMLHIGRRSKKKMTSVSSCDRHLLGNTDSLGWVLVQGRARRGKKKEKVMFCAKVLSDTPNSVFFFFVPV